MAISTYRKTAEIQRTYAKNEKVISKYRKTVEIQNNLREK